MVDKGFHQVCSIVALDLAPRHMQLGLMLLHLALPRPRHVCQSCADYFPMKVITEGEGGGRSLISMNTMSTAPFPTITEGGEGGGGCAAATWMGRPVPAPAMACM